jgi:hypothetical protein
MTKRKSAPPFIAVRSTTPATDAFLKTGNQDMVYWRYWAGICRTFANFFTDRAKRLHDSPDNGGSKTPLTVTEQINLLEQLQRTSAGMENCGYGSYLQQPVRHRPNIDHLVRRAREDVKDAEFPDLNEPSDQSDDQ